MSSAAQIVANQKNAQLSTGPRSPEGKAVAARNSAKHGLSGAFRVLPNEDQDEFDVLLACLADEFKPATEHESFLIEQMAQARWRLARIRRIESAVFDDMMSGEIDCTDPDQAMAKRFLSGGDRALATLQRYAAAAERSYYRAHQELGRSRQMRIEAETVKRMDAAVIGRMATMPPPASMRNEPKSLPKPAARPSDARYDNPALRL